MNPSVKQLGPWVPGWEDMRDHEVAKAHLEAEIELRRLEEERGLLQGRREEVEASLERLGESEESLRAKRTYAKSWGVLFLLAVAVTVLSAWWSVNWYLSLTWEKALLAVTLFVLPLVGWMVFLVYVRDRAQGRELWKIFAALGLVIILCSGVAGIVLGVGRMAGTALEEEIQGTQATGSSEDLVATAAPRETLSQARVARVKTVLGWTAAVAVILLGIAGEIAAGVAFHEYVKRMTVVWTVEPYYRERRELLERLAENGEREAEVRRWPQMRYVVLTIAGFQREADAARQAAEANRRDAQEARLREQAETERHSLGRLIKRVCLVFFLALGLVVGIVAIALGAEATVVIVDLSTSAGTQEEFSQNVRAVESLIQRVSPGGNRFAVFGITERSFSNGPLLSETSPTAAGRFGEYLADWRRVAAQRWRTLAEGLTPSFTRSDLFGALARASVEFEETPKTAKRLVIFSDMRQVGRGFNFERVMLDPRLVIGRVEREGFVPRLEGVQVWALGVHTAGVDERHWSDLRAFWSEFFKRSGAALKAFTPNRRLVEP